MIKSFIFKNFKSFRSSVLWLEQTTTLIGSNASGKSNALEGIYLLSELASGRELSAIFDESRSDSIVRGGAKGCCYRGSDSFTLGCTMDYDAEKDLLYEITVYVSGECTISEEKMCLVSNGATESSDEAFLFADSDYKKSRLSDFSNLIEAINASGGLVGEKLQLNRSCAEKIVHYLRNITLIEPIPSLMRGYNKQSANVLRRNGSNISAVLYALKKTDEEAWNRFCTLMQSLPENEISDLDFVTTALNDVILVEKEREQIVETTRLSDGTLRCLAALAAVFTVPEGSLLAIEEPDNGIHPARVAELMAALREVAKNRKVDLLLTTHNVTVLNSLDREAVMGVSIVYRDEAQNSEIVPFLDVRNQAALLAVSGIGDMLKSQKLLNAIKDDTPPAYFAF